ncbi:hypothetical protein LEBR102806_02720 [Levilactobacillus brevis]|jgi:hypothetical protein|uniref:Uncharacterized protein n=2 Tax=Levilactobacillus brevis TaxID=1580 RepID=Q03TN1_LEVBA|nr:hypothetical protein LVIS_0275 [Levilactobacillus brevis ATCC 367]AJA81163.1 hypothetical protein L747_09860 [Levilactobacillus brevis BSO 464]QCZ42676.1 hypothetical protein UCCLBBS124_0332 [Levilactobacillus brevis]QCZ52313.1 hypothetical protein UCCLBBS449_0323 [Levilactobacillus brevis]SQG74945.1 Uncharacterised protein [Levilactobacillus brevis]
MGSIVTLVTWSAMIVLIGAEIIRGIFMFRG